ncbi:MAG TPA: hypothetical protein VN936_00775, partial [Candidatus Acidoferrum sp.]|nr:hypothetical protein [Candidatus Acidoferrum sp.]
MNKGLIAGAIAFGLAYGAERLVAGMSKDIARYSRMREMSGEEPLGKELLGLAGGLFGDHGTSLSEGGGASALLAGLTNDLVRYA